MANELSIRLSGRLSFIRQEFSVAFPNLSLSYVIFPEFFELWFMSSKLSDHFPFIFLSKILMNMFLI